ncbi:winged helix-turn-helix domain-containing protein [Bizionia sp. KMM 8389]
MKSKGFIMLYRELTDWEWYTDINTCKVFTHCLLKVNYSKKRWQGIEIQKGEFITSNEKLAVETGLTVSKVRTALKKLESTGYISIKATVSYTKIGVLKHSGFVAETIHENSTPNSTPNSKPIDKPISNEMTNKSQTISNQIATTNINNNNIINRKKRFREKVYAHTLFNIKILDSFFNYWSELNTDETKMRFEIERFFEVKKRLDKWQANERPKRGNQKAKPELLTNRPNR